MNDALSKIAIVPVYRDVLSVIKVLNRFNNKIVDEICLVVDCADKHSLDEVAEAAAKVGTPFHIISHEKRKGIGYAIREGINYALAHRYEIGVVMAGNNKDDPQEIPRLLNPIINEGNDYVQGSRFLPGGEKSKNPVLRGLFSRIYPFIWTLLTGIRCTDVTNGFRAYRIRIFDDERVDIWQKWLNGYALEYYLHYKVLTLGYRAKEVPVSKKYPYRHKGGYSNISPFRDWWQIIGPLVCLRLGARK